MSSSFIMSSSLFRCVSYLDLQKQSPLFNRKSSFTRGDLTRNFKNQTAFLLQFAVVPARSTVPILLIRIVLIYFGPPPRSNRRAIDKTNAWRRVSSQSTQFRVHNFNIPPSTFDSPTRYSLHTHSFSL